MDRKILILDNDVSHLHALHELITRLDAELHQIVCISDLKQLDAALHSDADAFDLALVDLELHSGDGPGPGDMVVEIRHLLEFESGRPGYRLF